MTLTMNSMHYMVNTIDNDSVLVRQKQNFKAAVKFQDFKFMLFEIRASKNLKPTHSLSSAEVQLFTNSM
jgi:hypothetical protein